MKNKILKKVSKKIGSKPGSVVFVGEKKVETVKINIIDYDSTELKEYDVQSIEECFPFKDTETITWINIDGLHEEHIIEKLGNHFNVHALILEDIVNTSQRPKLEEGEGYIFIILKMLYLDSKKENVISEQVSLIFGKNYVISFQEQEGDVFQIVRDRLRKTIPRVRFIHADYLAYALIDAIVDHYFIVLEEIGGIIEVLEDVLIDNPKSDDLQAIHDLKRKLISMRKSTWPLREVVGGLDRSESKLIKKSTRAYLRDLYEHTIQVIDTVETFRDMVSSLLDIYLSSVSNKMNEVMKVLTIIATIFIPLGFLAGVYGMNFDTSKSLLNMPELGLPFGYILFWGLAVGIAGSLFIFFRRKGWL